MFRKKHILILILVIVAIAAISSVSASDVNATDETVDTDTNTEITTDDAPDTEAENGNVEVDYTNETYEDESDEEDDSYDSQITVKQSGKYIHDKAYTITLTDLNGTPMKNNLVNYFIYSDTSSNYDWGILETNANGMATYKWNYKKLPAGTYNVEFNCYDTYFEDVIFENVKVSKQSVKINPKALTTIYKSGKTFNIKVVDSNNKGVKGVRLTLKVYTGKKSKTVTLTTNTYGNAKYKASTLSKGTHKIIISAVNAKATKKTSKVVIKPRSLTIKTKSYKIKTRDFAGGCVDIQVKDKSSKKGLNGVGLTLKIYTGKKYKTVKLVTGYDPDDKKNGIAGILTNQYSVGTHKVKITPTSKNYKGSATAKIVITKIAKKNYYNFHIYFTKGKVTSKIYK